MDSNHKKLPESLVIRARDLSKIQNLSFRKLSIVYFIMETKYNFFF